VAHCLGIGCNCGELSWCKVAIVTSRPGSNLPWYLMATCPGIKLQMWQVVLVSSCNCGELSCYRVAIVASCPGIELQLWQVVLVASCLVTDIELHFWRVVVEINC
jgi:hypothetical protein